ncbi:MAG: hypothetical protein FJ297_00810 [Planctomycetes bacterium]|nr:hypothetical protein [Planctomycetota bacterium]
MITDEPSTMSLLGCPTGTLVLRVANTELRGREYRVPASKLAIGSSDQCGIRLPELDPLHCLILRGSERVVARRWSRDGRLNGFVFRDAPLVDGDRLSLGPYEIDIACLEGPESADHRIERLLERLDELQASLSMLEDRLGQDQEARRELETANAEWADRSLAWDAERAELERRAANAERSATREPEADLDPLEPSEHGRNEPNRVPCEPPGSESPSHPEPTAESAAATERDVLSRLRNAGVWRNEVTSWRDFELGPESDDAEPTAADSSVERASPSPVGGGPTTERVGHDSYRPLGDSTRNAPSGRGAARAKDPMSIGLGSPRGSDDADDAIEVYMSRLMSRVRGKSEVVESRPSAREDKPESPPVSDRFAHGAASDGEPMSVRPSLPEYGPDQKFCNTDIA